MNGQCCCRSGSRSRGNPWLALALMPALLLGGCRFVVADLSEERGGVRILQHEDRRVGVGTWRWYTVEFNGREASVGEPWYASERTRFERAALVPGSDDRVIVKVLGVSRGYAYSHYATFLLEMGTDGRMITTRLSPEDHPTADGVDVHWPITGQDGRQTRER